MARMLERIKVMVVTRIMEMRICFAYLLAVVVLVQIDIRMAAFSILYQWVYSGYPFVRPCNDLILRKGVCWRVSQEGNRPCDVDSECDFGESSESTGPPGLVTLYIHKIYPFFLFTYRFRNSIYHQDSHPPVLSDPICSSPSNLAKKVFYSDLRGSFSPLPTSLVLSTLSANLSSIPFEVSIKGPSS
jgi:hypothetical protein